MLNLHLGLSGEYRCRVYKSKSGVMVQDTGWFDNLILDSGLDEIGVQVANTIPRHTEYIVVGSGSTAPAVGDLQLESEVARTAAATSSPSVSIDTVDRFATLQRSASFLSGSAAGNLSEVGASRYSSAGAGNLFSRSLIKDSEGSPTTITVASDEDLVVDYRYRIKQPTGGFAGSVPDSSLTYTGDIVGANGTSWWGGTNEKWTVTSTYTTFIAETALRGITDSPDSGASNRVASITYDSYVGGSFQMGIELFWDTDSANNANQLLFISNNMCTFQVLFSDPITKTNVDTLRVGYTLSWGRYTP